MALVSSNNNNPNQPKGGPGSIGKILPTIPMMQKLKPMIISTMNDYDTAFQKSQIEFLFYFFDFM